MTSSNRHRQRLRLIPRGFPRLAPLLQLWNFFEEVTGAAIHGRRLQVGTSERKARI